MPRDAVYPIGYFKCVVVTISRYKRVISNPARVAANINFREELCDLCLPGNEVGPSAPLVRRSTCKRRSDCQFSCTEQLSRCHRYSLSKHSNLGHASALELQLSIRTICTILCFFIVRSFLQIVRLRSFSESSKFGLKSRSRYSSQ